MNNPFDSPWFALERPAFQHIAKWSGPTLTIALLIAALILVGLALHPKTPALVKAIVLAYILLP